MIIFGYSSVVIILVGFFFLKISRTSTYSRSFLTEESKNSVMDYGQGWGVVKGDAIGLFFTAWFFVYEVTSTKFTREILKEVLISIIASIFMGLGTLFLLLWVGIYV